MNRGIAVNGPDQRVGRVSWQDARGFCRWLSERTGKRFDLPTEAQWLHARGSRRRGGAEWTRSSYRPYPYDTEDGRDTPRPIGLKAVRGLKGPMPSGATARDFRWRYPSWQRVYNVGFCVLCEDDL